YLPLRSGAQLPLDIGDPQTWGRMIRHMFVTSDASARMSLYLGRLPVQLHRFGGWIVEEFSLPLLLAGLLGWGLICHRVPRLGISHLLLFFGIVGFFIRTWTRPFGFVPGFMVYALAIAVGVQWLRGRLPARLLPLFLLLLAGLLVRNGVRHGRMNRKFDTARRHALAIARSLPQGALLFSANDNVSLSIAYLRFVEGRRPDLSHVHRSILFDRRRRPWQWPHMQPECIPTGYDPGRAQETLLPAVRRNLPVCPAFWDYGRDEDRYIPVTFLLPHGILFRITAEPLPLSAGVFDEQERWFAPFRRIVADLDPADWTGVENYVRVWNILGEYYDRRGDRKAAERAFREALSIAPEDPTALTNLGSLHARRGAWETAAALFERAIEADPTYLLAYDHLAAVSVACHAYDRAVELLETSLRIAPDQPEIRLRLARIELERGNPDAAARQLDLLRDAPPRIREAAARERPKVDFLRGECDRLLQDPSLLRPDDPEHLFIAGVCAARAGRIDLARRRLEAARDRCIGPCEERGFGNQIRTILRNLQDAQHDERGKRKP
ncbi:MAG: tetratricopeptide repeat protein, partial [Deltaproteobacteria bacterium]